MLTDTELDDMRNVLNESLPDRCHVKRPANTSDGYGGWAQGWSNISTNVPCRISPAVSDRGFDVLIGGAPHATSEWNITLPADVPILPSDRIVLVDGSRQWECRQIIARSWEISLRIFAVEVL